MAKRSERNQQKQIEAGKIHGYDADETKCLQFLKGFWLTAKCPEQQMFENYHLSAEIVHLICQFVANTNINLDKLHIKFSFFLCKMPIIAELKDFKAQSRLYEVETVNLMKQVDKAYTRESLNKTLSTKMNSLFPKGNISSEYIISEKRDFYELIKEHHNLLSK